jgi:hypothetical protein
MQWKNYMLVYINRKMNMLKLLSNGGRWGLRIVRTFVNVTMYPQYNNNMIIKIFKNSSPLLLFLFPCYLSEFKQLMNGRPGF